VGSIRHFEKKGSLGLFRRIEASGSTLDVALGEASIRTQHFTVELESAPAARRLADTWSRWALDAGFAEIPLERGTPGIVFHLETPLGPGRVRDDEGRNILFEPTAVASSSLRQGQRVVLQGVRARRKASVGFMLGSKLQADRLLPFPVTPWKRFKARPGPSAKVSKLLAALAGGRITGSRVVYGRELGVGSGLDERLPCGTLIFAYRPGVHRFLSRTPGNENGDFVISEPVLGATLQRVSGPLMSQVASHCEPVPVVFRRALEKHFGLGR